MSSSIFSASYADKVIIFDSEAELYEIIRSHLPCILCKGPDYAGKRVTGDDIAPVIILDTPETDEVREFKKLAYML
jgi:bifunctional ADP-heptose synthase (sugar kinase/adenylyltransferase)